MREWEFHCKILGISSDSTIVKIRKAYHENAKLLHPDHHNNSDLAKEKFQQINEAYSYLTKNWEARRTTSPPESKPNQQSTFSSHSDNNSQGEPSLKNEATAQADTINSEITMEQFIHLVVKEIYKPSARESVLKTIGILAIGNLISLPFGRVFFGYSMNKSHREVEVDFMQSLTSPFAIGFFENELEKQRKTALKKEYFTMLDAIPNEYKLKILTVALKNQEQYKLFVNKGEWRYKKASGE